MFVDKYYKMIGLKELLETFDHLLCCIPDPAQRFTYVSPTATSKVGLTSPLFQVRKEKLQWHSELR